MHSKTKIIVLHMKEVVYTGIFIFLGVLFLILIMLMFFSDDKKKTPNNQNSAMAYVPGIYNTSLSLGQNNVELEIVLDKDNINSIRLVSLDEAVTTMYPLIEPALNSIAEQIYDTQSLEGITFSDENRYTSTVLLNAIETTLEKAAPMPSANETTLNP